MTNYLLDTHTLLWSQILPEKLPSNIKATLENPRHTIKVSAISFWEISIKYSLGKLNLKGGSPDDLLRSSKKAGFSHINLSIKTTTSYYQLKKNSHKDPFDRLLVWQAINQNYTLISKDQSLGIYKPLGLKLLWS
jgi:PIN domain nuclease of toxin-antitoxin system